MIVCGTKDTALVSKCEGSSIFFARTLGYMTNLGFTGTYSFCLVALISVVLGFMF